METLVSPFPPPYSPSHSNLRTSMAAWGGGQRVGMIIKQTTGTYRVQKTTQNRAHIFMTRVEATVFRDRMSDAAGKTRNQWRRVDGNRIEMQIPQGRSFFFDDADLQWVLARLPWNMNEKGYVVRNCTVRGTTKKKVVRFARERMGPPPDMVVDHIDGKPNNNTTSNLRIITQRQNMRNSRMSTRNRSGIANIG